MRCRDLVAAGRREACAGFLAALEEAAAQPASQRPDLSLPAHGAAARRAPAGRLAQRAMAGADSAGPPLRLGGALRQRLRGGGRSGLAAAGAGAGRSAEPDGGASSAPRCRVTPALFRLAPAGWPAGAILWKNLVAATRTRRVRNAAIALGAAGVIVAVLSFDPEGTLAEIAGLAGCLMGGHHDRGQAPSGSATIFGAIY